MSVGFFFFFKQKTAYEITTGDWSSDVCSSDLGDRSLRRGHHPAERLARELGERWELPVEPLLRRARPVKRQRGLPLAERRANVRDAFEAAARAPTTVAVVDDVYTSGSTASAGATALRKADARSVSIVTFAR